MSAKRTLHEGWRLSAGDGSRLDVEDLPASVPGSVHTDLLAAGLIPDPFVDRHEEELSWIGRTDWTYRTEFDYRSEPHDGVELCFDGLDTVAKVTLNGRVVGEAANMHRRHRFDVREALRDGVNELEVAFTSPYTYAESQRERLGARPNSYDPEPGNFIRKVASDFGWDWGPNLAGAGIWRPVRLETWSIARLDQVVPRVTVADGRGVVELAVRLRRAADTDVELVCAVGGSEKTVSLPSEVSETVVRIEVDDPQLWWPRGFGEQPLYPASIALRGHGTELDSWERRIGFRTVELDTEPDADGRPYNLKVNGRKVWIKGVNWIPDDALHTRVDAARYERRLLQAVGANVNYVRVWGGGRYEADEFYEACDRLGLMVAQDFLFSCAAYPEEEPFWSEVEAEARDNLVRLAPHPSLVTWNGNNENIWGWHDWGWQPRLGDRTWGEGYYLDLLPGLVEEIDGTRPYWPGSPYSGDRSIHPNDQANGSVHIWDVWNDLDYSHYRDWRPRFVGEFGYQAPATWATVRRMVTDEPLEIASDNMLWHQKAENGQGKLQRGLDAHLPVPRDFDDWLYFTQVNQARALRLGIEYFRSLQPYCSGAVMWQLNDCWPVTSWAAVDSEERRKPLWYSLRDSFTDRLLTFQPEGEGVKLVAVNDTDRDWNDPVVFWKCSREGEILGRAKVELEIGPRDTAEVRLDEQVLPADGEFLVTGPHDGPRATWFTKEDKDMEWAQARFGTEVRQVEGGVSVTVEAETVLRDLCVFADRLDPDAEVDKAMVTLIPGEKTTFTVSSQKLHDDPELAEALCSKPVLRAVND